MTRILVVEDEVSFSDPLSYLLRKEGYDVAVAETGPDALTEFDANGADLVLLDLMLPGLPGVDVCRALRARSNVPVIMLTAKDSEIDKVVGLELGADDYVTKPYSSRELLARIKAVLRRLSEPEELLPTTVEAGFPNSDYDFWIGFFAPAKLPPAIAEQLRRATATALKSPEVKARYAALGANSPSVEPEQFEAFVKNDAAAATALIKTAHITQN